VKNTYKHEKLVKTMAENPVRLGQRMRAQNKAKKENLKKKKENKSKSGKKK
jgi:hypothetical protein